MTDATKTRSKKNRREQQTNSTQPVPGNIQTIIDEVVWYHGADPLSWSAAVFLGLAARGVMTEHLTKHRLDLANHRSLELQKERLQKSRLGHPIRDDFTIPDDATKEEVIQKLMRLRELRNCRHDNSNGGKGVPQRKEKTVATTVMQVKESEMRSALAALGIVNAEDAKKWPLKKLNQKVADAKAFSDLLEDLADQGSTPEGADKDLLTNISDALAEGGEVHVVSDRLHEGNGHSKGEGMTTATATPKKTKKAPAHREMKKGPVEPKKGSLLSAAIEVMAKALASKAKDKKKFWKSTELYEEIVRQGLWSSSAKTPWMTLSSAMYTEIGKKGKDARFGKTDEGFFLND